MKHAPKTSPAQDMNGFFQRLKWQQILGLVLCMAGGMILVDQILHVPWLSVFAPVLSGLLLMGVGLRTQGRGYVIAGSIILGAGFGAAAAYAVGETISILQRLGLAAIGLASGFGLISAAGIILYRGLVWWPLIPLAAVGGLGFAMTFTHSTFFDYVLYILTGLGLVFLAIGIFKRLIGLIIPGCLLIGIGPGVAFAWGHAGAGSALSQTGVMLVWFALGWGLITLFSRVVIDQFVWWPLIPGGILAMVGWGLYIGGSPDNAASFIGNTGSIAMIIFGVYLLLMRRGIRR